MPPAGRMRPAIVKTSLALPLNSKHETTVRISGPASCFDV